MALYKSELMTGSGLSETLLWENTATSVGTGVTILTNNKLKEVIGIYDYFKFVWRAEGSDANSEVETIVLNKGYVSNNRATFQVSLGSNYMTGTYKRELQTSSPGAAFTTSAGYRSTTSGNSYAVPMKMYGLK